MTLLYILLAVIAYILWRIYRQREEEKEQIASEKFDADWEQKKREEFKDYPHLIGNINDTWLELFGKLYVEKGYSHLKAAWLIYFKEANNSKLDMEVDHLFDSLWNLSEELLEHLEKYHESSKYEYEIAILTYWQIIAEKSDSLIGKDIESIKKIFQSPPFSDIQKIVTWFPKIQDHPKDEISFIDEKTDLFPRESKGSAHIHEKLKALGL
jgi:hypothetical protein